MKEYKDILEEDVYDDDKKFRKAYDTLNDAMADMSKVLKGVKHKQSRKAIQLFNTAWEDIEQSFNVLD